MNGVRMFVRVVIILWLVIVVISSVMGSTVTEFFNQGDCGNVGSIVWVPASLTLYAVCTSPPGIWSLNGQYTGSGKRLVATSFDCPSPSSLAVFNSTVYAACSTGIVSIDANDLVTLVVTAAQCPPVSLLYMSSAGILFANCGGASSGSTPSIISFTTATSVVTTILTAATCQSPIGMAYRESTNTLFTVCYNNVFSSISLGPTTVSPLPVTCGAAANPYVDQATGYVYIGCAGQNNIWSDRTGSWGLFATCYSARWTSVYAGVVYAFCNDNHIDQFDASGTPTAVTGPPLSFSGSSGMTIEPASGTIYFSCGSAGIISTGCMLGETYSAGSCTACQPGKAGSLWGKLPSCATCGVGYYAATSRSTACVGCAAGTYNPIAGSSSCIDCPTGRYTNLPMSTVCTNCTVGYYQPLTGQVSPSLCIPCPPGTMSDVAGIGPVSSCRNCPIGKASSIPGSSTCTACSAGYYSDTPGSISCAPCPANTYNSFVGANSTSLCLPCPISAPISPVGSTSAYQCVTPPCAPGNYTKDVDVNALSCQDLCPVASYCIGGVVRVCSAGRYQNETGGNSAASCKLCPIGTASSIPGSSSCSSCAAGTFSSTTGVLACTPCPANTYSSTVGAVSVTQCISCPISSPLAQPGSSFLSQCTVPICAPGNYTANDATAPCLDPCPVGQYCVNSVVRTCPAGTFNNITGGSSSSSCRPCEPGSSAPSAGTIECAKCSAGFYQPNAGALSCSACPANTYQPNLGAISILACVSCPISSPLSASASTSISQCSSPVCGAGNYTAVVGSIPCQDECPEGQWCANGVAHLCAAGTFNNITGGSSSSSCRPCEPGSSAPSAGTIECAKCSAGFYQPNEGTFSCTPCPVNTYLGDLGASNVTQCLPCPLSTPLSLQGSFSINNCYATPCSPGLYTVPGDPPCSHTCEPGHFCQNGVSFPCGVGRYTSESGRAIELDCLPCARGRFSSIEGVSTCTDCLPGYWQGDEGAIQCVPCGENTYQPMRAANSSDMCRPCPGSTPISQPASSSDQQCFSQPCEPGWYTSSSTSNISCSTPCPPGSFCIFGALHLCPAGTILPNLGGKADTDCIPCEIGSVNPSPGAATCTPCKPGTFQPSAGELQCRPCPVNTYSDVSGATNCTACPPIAPSSILGSSSLSACTVPVCQDGFYTLLGEPACGAICPVGFSCRNGAKTACAPGSFAANVKQSDCTPCGSGNYSTILGSMNSTDCRPCPLGLFSNHTISSSCEPCPQGTVTEEVGAGSIELCVRLWDSACVQVYGQKGNSSADVDLLCPLSASRPIPRRSLLPESTKLLSQPGGVTFNASTGGRLGALRSSQSLRAAAFSNQAASVGVQAGPEPTFSSNAGGRLITDTVWLGILIGLVVLAAMPLLFFRFIPARLAAVIDRFSGRHHTEVGAHPKIYPTQWGAVLSWSFVCVAALVALLLGSASNTELVSMLIPPFASNFAGTANADFEITMRFFAGVDSVHQVCNGQTLTPVLKSQTGISCDFGMKTNPSDDGTACGIAFDGSKCGLLSATASITFQFPFDSQLIEWELFASGAGDNAFSRYYGVQQQRPGELMDAVGELQFSLMESYLVQDQHLVASGFGLGYLQYHTRQPQSLDNFRPESTVEIDFSFQRSDVVFQSEIHTKLTTLQLLSVIISAIGSIFAGFGILFTLSERVVGRVVTTGAIDKVNEKYVITDEKVDAVGRTVLVAPKELSSISIKSNGWVTSTATNLPKGTDGALDSTPIDEMTHPLSPSRCCATIEPSIPQPSPSNVQVALLSPSAISAAISNEPPGLTNLPSELQPTNGTG